MAAYAIVRAAMNGDVATVQQWLDDGNDANAQFNIHNWTIGYGETLLHMLARGGQKSNDSARERGRCDVARLLLARGATVDALPGDPELTDYYVQNTPLFIAAIFG